MCMYISTTDIRGKMPKDTKVGAMGVNDKATRELFNANRHVDILDNNPDFLIDLRESNGDIVDTIGVSAANFELITGVSADEVEYE